MLFRIMNVWVLNIHENTYMTWRNIQTILSQKTHCINLWNEKDFHSAKFLLPPSSHATFLVHNISQFILYAFKLHLKALLANKNVLKRSTAHNIKFEISNSSNASKIQFTEMWKLVLRYGSLCTHNSFASQLLHSINVAGGKSFSWFAQSFASFHFYWPLVERSQLNLKRS